MLWIDFVQLFLPLLIELPPAIPRILEVFLDSLDHCFVSSLSLVSPDHISL
jgi:hypothetical protein